MKRALPAAGAFVLVLGLLDPIRLPELAAGLAAAAGTAAVVLLPAAAASRAACRRHSREALPPAVVPPAACRWSGQSPTQPMNFWHPPERYHGPDLSSVYEAWPDGHEPPPADWDALHLNVARDWDAVMRRPDETWGTADMTEFEQKWKLS